MICSVKIKKPDFDKLVERFGMSFATRAYLDASVNNQNPTYNEVVQLMINDYYKASEIMKVGDDSQGIYSVLATDEQIKQLDNLLVNYKIISKTNKFFNEVKIEKPSLEFEGKIKATTTKISDFVSFDLPDAPLQFSKEKIKTGEKTITVRPTSYRSQSKTLIDGVPVSFTNKGSLTINEAIKVLGLESKEDFKNKFVGAEEVKFDYIKDFLEGKSRMYVYDIKRIAEGKSFDIEDPNGDSRYLNEVSRLSKLRDQLYKTKKKTTDQEAKDRIDEKIDLLKAKIKALQKDSNHNIGVLLEQAEAHLIEASAILDDKGISNTSSIDLALAYAYPYQELLLKFDIEDAEQVARKNILFNQIMELMQKIKKKQEAIAAAEVNKATGSNIMINGLIIPAKDTSVITSYTADVSKNQNKLVQTLSKLIKTAQNTIVDLYNAFESNHKKISKELKSYQKSNGIADDKSFDFMLQINDGLKTGYYVTKQSYKYITNKYSAFRGKTIDKLDFLNENHSISINKEALDKYNKWIDDNTEVFGEHGQDNFEATEKAKDSKKRAINPETFIKILNKAKKKEDLSADEKQFAENYIKYNMTLLNLELNENNIDAKFTELEKLRRTDPTNPKIKFYDHFVDNIVRGRNMVNESEDSYGLAMNYIPEVEVLTPFYKNLPNKLKNQFAQSPENGVQGKRNPITGELEPEIPMYSLSGTFKNNPQGKAYDLDRVLEKFTLQAYNKNYKESIEDKALALLETIKNQQVYEVNSKGDIVYENGRPVYKTNTNNNSYQQAKYYIWSNLYDKSQAIEGNTGRKVHTPEVLAEINRLKEIEKPTDEEKALLAKLELTGRDITAGGIGNAAIKYTALKALGFNFFGGASEILQGIFSNSIEAAGGQFYKRSNLIRAWKLLFSAIGNPSQREKINALIKNFGLIGELDPNVERGNKITEAAFAHLRFADFLAKGATVLSLLDTMKVKDRKGVEHNLLDVIDVNGANIVLKGDFDQIYSHSIDEAGNFIPSQAKLDFQAKAQTLSKNLHARDGSKDPILLNKNILGRLVGQFRASWMIEAFDRRFGTEKEIPLLQTKTVGFYNKVFADKEGKVSIKRGLKVLWLYRFNKKGLAEMGLEEMDEIAIRKMLRELTFMMSTYTTFLVLSAMLKGDDDDDDNVFLDGTLNYLMNQSYRSNRDMTFFISPNSASEISANIAPAMKTMTDFTKVAGDIISTIAGDPYVYEGTKREKLRIFNSIPKAFPFVNKPEALYRLFTEDYFKKSR